MGKISPVAIKYIIKTEITTIGMVEKPDVIGAIFGQTEGLLGQDLELRELQKSGRIGRIEVRLKTEKGKTTGTIELPSSMDKAETAIIAAALETIDRIGPCEATVRVKSVEDVREIKRRYIIERAKSVLKETLSQGPDTQELISKVSNAVRQAEIVGFGKEKLPAGPMVGEADELILVEGRADVLTLLKYGIKNALALGGTKMPKEAIALSRIKETTIFVDGDRGGELIVKDVLTVSDIDFVARAPDGKEVEELTGKEIQKALRSKETSADFLANNALKSRRTSRRTSDKVKTVRRRVIRGRASDSYESEDKKHMATRTSSKAAKLSSKKKEQFKKLLEDLLGTRGAYLLSGVEILGKVPTTELSRYLEILNADTVVMDGKVNSRIASICKSRGIGLIVGTEADKIYGVDVLVKADLEVK